MGKDEQGESKKKKKSGKGLPEHLEQQATHVTCGPARNYHVNTFTAANVFRPLGVDNAWNLSEFKELFEIKIVKLDAEAMEFDLIGCDPAIANALRRILIADIPTIAVEHVFMINNTSIIQDEVLAHRLGLVPLKIRPDLLEYKLPEEAPSEKNTIVFKLDIACKRSGDTIKNDKVLSGSMQWLPGGSQIPDETGARFAAGQGHLVGADAPCLVHDDILLAKLRPGQCIVLEAHCIKGVGKEHAKWSPVATAWYRLHPEIKMLKEADDEVAEKLLAAAPGLFFRDAKSNKLCVGSARGHENVLEKVRLLLEDEGVASTIQLLKRKDHFIFTIESTGVLPPEELLTQAIDILHEKAHRLSEKL